MIGTGSALIAALALFLLIWIWVRADATSRELPLALDERLPGGGEDVEAVSYTHLTLPTICSV